MCWTLRTDQSALEQDLHELSDPKNNIVQLDVDGYWFVVKYDKRQAPVPGAVRTAAWRKRTETVTESHTDEDEDVDKEDKKDDDEEVVVDPLDNLKADYKEEFTAYEQNINIVDTQHQTLLLIELIEEYGRDIFLEAVRTAVENNKPTFSYMKGVIWNQAAIKRRRLTNV